MKYIILILLFSLTASATLNDVDKQMMVEQNQLLNGGFENGKGSDGSLWTASGGTFLIVNSGSNLLSGKASATWDSNTADQTLQTSLIAVKNGLKGRPGVAMCNILTPSGTATHTLSVSDGTNTISSLNPVVSSTSPVKSSASFLYPSSGSVRLVLKSVAAESEPLIAIDDCYLGPADGVNIGQYAAAQFIGSAYIETTANCAGWTRTNTALGLVATDADCPGPTVEFNPGPGTIQTTDVDLPQFTVNSLPPGNYKVVMTASAIVSGSSAHTAARLSDGTTQSGSSGLVDTANRGPLSIEGWFSYTTAGNRTFDLFVSASTGTITFSNDVSNKRVYFTITRFPTVPEQTFRADTVASSWSGHHDQTCSFPRTNTSQGDFTADASCALTAFTSRNLVVESVAGFLPGIRWTPKRAGTFEVCLTAQLTKGTAGELYRLYLVNGAGTTIARMDNHNESSGSSLSESASTCAMVQATDTTEQSVKLQGSSTAGAFTIGGNPAISWTVKQIDQTFPVPVAINSVVSKYSGVSGIEAAKINCDGAPAITSQMGTWVSSAGGAISGGVCTITLVSGIFSSAPYCVANYASNFPSVGRMMSVNATSATSLTVDCEDDGSTACADWDADILCMGPR
jgi:hypothetical protein